MNFYISLERALKQIVVIIVKAKHCKVRLLLTLDQAKLHADDRERSRQYDLDRLRVEHNIPTLVRQRTVTMVSN